MNITLGLQQWEQPLADLDGDGVWEGAIEWRPETTGRPLLKIVAKDGEGDQASIDFMSRNLVVEAPPDDMRGLVAGAFSLGILSLVGLTLLVVGRRRRAQVEFEEITSWDAFRSPGKEATEGSPTGEKLEGDAMDGTNEVNAELELDLD